MKRSILKTIVDDHHYRIYLMYSVWEFKYEVMAKFFLYGVRGVAVYTTQCLVLCFCMLERLDTCFRIDAHLYIILANRIWIKGGLASSLAQNVR